MKYEEKRFVDCSGIRNLGFCPWFCNYIDSAFSEVIAMTPTMIALAFGFVCGTIFGGIVATVLIMERGEKK